MERLALLALLETLALPALADEALKIEPRTARRSTAPRRKSGHYHRRANGWEVGATNPLAANS